VIGVMKHQEGWHGVREEGGELRASRFSFRSILLCVCC
jgi:hypothetical protein